MLEEIIRLINYIGELHEEFSSEFFEGREKLNFKTKRVDHVVDEESYDEKFIAFLHDYIDALAFFQIFHTFDSKNNKIETRFRGKNRESALNKLYHYRFNKDPKVGVQKCLNDLLGFRLIIDTELNYPKIKEEIENSKGKSVEFFRSYVREDEGYLGLHIYLKGQKINSFLPWELQIWKKDDALSNEYSHKQHKEKRQYINWTEIYKENKRREES